MAEAPRKSTILQGTCKRHSWPPAPPRPGVSREIVEQDFMQPGELVRITPQPALTSRPRSLGETHNTMKSAIAALAIGAVGTNAFVTPNAVVGRVATRSARQVLFTFDVAYMCVCGCW